MSEFKTIRVETWYFINEHPDFTGCLIDEDSDIAWYKNGEWHREDGPAIEWIDGCKEWWLNGERLTEQQHRMIVRKMKLKLLDKLESALQY